MFEESGTDSDSVEQFTKQFMAHVKTKKIGRNAVNSKEDVSESSGDEKIRSHKKQSSKHLSNLQTSNKNQLSDSSSDGEWNENDENSNTSSDHDDVVQSESDTGDSEQDVPSEYDDDLSEDNKDTNKEQSEESADELCKDDIGQDSDEIDDDKTEDTFTAALKTEVEHDGDDDSNNNFAKLRKELADLPFSDLQKLKEKIGIKAYNQAMFGTASGQKSKRKFKRENKNRPTEMSSKRTVPRFREVIQVKKKVKRDPRFDDLSGEYDERVFQQTYSFISDIKQREKQKLVKSYQKEKDLDKKKQLEDLIKRLNQQEKSEREKGQKIAKQQEARKKAQESLKEGKNPYYFKKSDQKKLELAEKFKELSKSGKLDKYLAKKRKKMAAKDRKHLPNKHFV